MKNFGIIPNPRFSENYPFFEAFDLPTVSLQRNEQPLFVVTYAKRAEQLKVRIRKTKKVSISQTNGIRELKGHSLLVVRFNIVQSISQLNLTVFFKTSYPLAFFKAIQI